MNVVCLFFAFLLIFLLFVGDCGDTHVFRLKAGSPRRFSRSIGCHYVGEVVGHHVCRYHFRKISSKHVDSIVNTSPFVREFYKDEKRIREKRDFNDPGFKQQWYLHMPGIRSGRSLSLRHDVSNVWASGINGSGVVVAVIDDGVFVEHIDLKENINREVSYDYIDYKKNPDSDQNRHGTRCIGLIAAVANNQKCGVGIAFGSTVAAIRILSGQKTLMMDSLEAFALAHKFGTIDVFSMSWGPEDNGVSMDGPGRLSIQSFRNGILRGRQGKGAVFVFSSGNGGRHLDHCGFDGYLQRPEVLVIGSMTDVATFPPYGEKCSAVLAATLSSRDSNPKNMIYTTDTQNRCGKVHSGTSVSAPLAAGMFALLLQANPRLTWRDVTNLVVRTSVQYDSDAITNAAGYKYSTKFGFGLIDVDALVSLGKSDDFVSLDPLHVCNTPVFEVNKKLSRVGSVSSSVYVTGCLFRTYCVTSIEQVMVTITITVDTRNSVALYLTSPSGTTLPVIEPRKNDTSDSGFESWVLKVMSFYGESPVGLWTLRMENNDAVNAQFVSWSISFWGSCDESENTKKLKETVLNICNENSFKCPKLDVYYKTSCRNPSGDDDVVKSDSWEGTDYLASPVNDCFNFRSSRSSEVSSNMNKTIMFATLSVVASVLVLSTLVLYVRYLCQRFLRHQYAGNDCEVLQLE